ncbi:MAG: hypothetical protein Q7K26_02595 [bacterium]|nr:hypothetical protein [bacterium]
MNNIINNDRMTKIISVVLTVVFGVLLISLVANAVTTISTNITTDGNATITGTLGVTGVTTLTNASSTITSQTGNFMVNGFATTTATNGNIATAGTLAVTGTSVLTGDVTMSGGSGALVITTSNSATSTIQVGCVQMYATSTDTAVRLTFGLPGQEATTTTQGAASIGNVVWQYGSCPI